MADNFKKLMLPNELRDAWEHLTPSQRDSIEKLRRTHSISGIACKLALTRSFVHSYIRKLNGGEVG